MRKRAVTQIKVTYWYFVITNKKGKEEIVGYGDSREYKQDEAFQKMKEKFPNCRIATQEDENRLF